jgi:hypothetical protein
METVKKLQSEERDRENEAKQQQTQQNATEPKEPVGALAQASHDVLESYRRIWNPFTAPQDQQPPIPRRTIDSIHFGVDRWVRQTERLNDLSLIGIGGIFVRFAFELFQRNHERCDFTRRNVSRAVATTARGNLFTSNDMIEDRFVTSLVFMHERKETIQPREITKQMLVVGLPELTTTMKRTKSVVFVQIDFNACSRD